MEDQVHYTMATYWFLVPSLDDGDDIDDEDCRAIVG
jgi:hypothetical protein